jgi:hypothetical protein
MDDPTVRDLIERFDAELDPESVTPAKPSGSKRGESLQ